MLSGYLHRNSPSLSADHTALCSVGDLTELPPHIRMLNAAGTFVGSFQFLWDILDVAPAMERIILGQVHFVEFPPAPKQYALAELILNATNVTTDHIRSIAQALPLLKTFDVSFCPPPNFDVFLELRSLTNVHLDGLALKDFGYVSNTIGLLPQVEFLSLCHNDIELVPYIEGRFQALQILLLKSCKIKDVFALDGIAGLPQLQELNLQRNPLQEVLGEIEARLIVIGRFPRVQKLNGSPVTPSEFRQAEIQYLQHFAADVAANGIARHPRWPELVAKYDAPAVPAAPTEKKRSVTVQFVYGEQQIQKVIPLTMKIGMLAGNVARLFKLKSTEIELAIENGNYQGYLPYPEQALSEVGCVDGSIIRVGKIGDHLFDQVKQAKSFKIRSISEQIAEGD
jgi:hypothetical protein